VLVVLPGARQLPAEHDEHCVTEESDDPPADHVPDGHAYAGEPAVPGQYEPAAHAAHEEPLRKNPGRHEAVPTKETPNGPRDHDAPEVAPSSTQRLVEASKLVPA